MVVDFHVHLFPKWTIENWKTLSQTDDYFGFVLARWGEKVLISDADLLIKTMDANGVDQMVLQGWPFHSHEHCVMQNNTVLEAMETYPGKIMGFAVVNPNDGCNAYREIERCFARGMQGIGQLNPEAQSFNFEQESFLRICDLCIDHEKPLSIHVSEPIGPYYYGKSQNSLNEYVQLAEGKPLLEMILPNFGGGLPFYERMPEIGKRVTNVFYETSVDAGEISRKAYQTTIDIIGRKRLLFGSNYPLLTKKYTSMLEDISSSITVPEDRAAILGDNAKKLCNQG